MKANAPEKIYIVDATFPDYVDFDGSPINTKRIDDHDIEYIRKDAFIEKACEWIKEHKEAVETEDNGIMGWIPDYFIDDFVKFMRE